MKLFRNHSKILNPQLTDVYHIDDICNLKLLDLKGYGPKNDRGLRYV